VGFVVDKVALGQVFSEYFGFPCTIFIPSISPQSPSPIIRGWYNRPVVPAVPKIPRQKIEKNIVHTFPPDLLKLRLRCIKVRLKFPHQFALLINNNNTPKTAVDKPSFLLYI
jgi:hypothetical protein